MGVEVKKGGNNMADQEEIDSKFVSAFEEVDVEGTGKIGMNQLQNIIEITAYNESLEGTEGNLNKVLKIAGADEDQWLSLEELLALIKEKNDSYISGCFIRLADKGNKGFTTANEVKSVLEMTGAPAEDGPVKILMAIADSNGDKKLQTEEVIKMMKAGDEIMNNPKEVAKIMFKVADTNDDGYIDKRELRQYCKDLGQDMEIVIMMLTILDKDNNEMLNYDEFCRFFG